jgi:hypothetical protein
MLKYKGVVFIFFFILGFNLKPVFSQDLTIEEIIKRQDELDQKEISISGEIIGEALCRKGGCWFNINDGNFAIGVWVPEEIRFKPKYIGSYKYRGDKILVDGIFNRRCKQHLGELDIHAKKITLLKEGEVIEERIDKGKIFLSILIWVGVCLILILMRLSRK